MLSGWTLFLDRDGVINTRLPGEYIDSWKVFEFEKGTLEALSIFTPLFECIVIVTNQQGIGKGLMTVEDLEKIHQKMLAQITINHGRIDKIYHCSALANDDSFYRKPNTGMAIAAKKDFPNINFSKSIMVGDSASDMEFGLRLGMKTIHITTKPEDIDKILSMPIDLRFDSLYNFALYLKSNGLKPLL